MTEKFFFADVETPFHVWVKEGARWVLRDAASDLQIGEGASLQRKAPGADRGAAAIKPSKAA